MIILLCIKCIVFCKRPRTIGASFLGEWITPTVTGDRPPPINQFSLTPVTNNTAILFGGETPNHEDSNIVYIIDFTKTSVVSVVISII